MRHVLMWIVTPKSKCATEQINLYIRMKFNHQIISNNFLDNRKNAIASYSHPEKLDSTSHREHVRLLIEFLLKYTYLIKFLRTQSLTINISDSIEASPMRY